MWSPGSNDLTQCFPVGIVTQIPIFLSQIMPLSTQKSSRCFIQRYQQQQLKTGSLNHKQLQITLQLLPGHVQIIPLGNYTCYESWL